jgi:hypothetical protein
MTTPKFVGPYCLKQRRLAKIWRAIARRHLSRSHALENQLDLLNCALSYHDSDSESDP